MRISPLFLSGLGKACLAGWMCLLIAVVPMYGQAGADGTGSTTKKHTASKAAAGKHKAGSGKKSGRLTRRRGTPSERRAKTARLRQAFVASTELRPMAQQLITLRMPAAYAGVTRYAQQHTGDASGAAYLSLGRAYQLDKRYPDAVTALHLARQHSELLADYADYLAAECLHAQGNEAAAEALLRGFDERYPDSIFDVEAPELEANVLLSQGNATAAQRALLTVAEEARDKPNYELTQAKIAYAIQQNEEALRLFKHLLLSHPLTTEAEEARARLTAMGAETSLTPAELRSLGDAYYNAGRYNLASEQYHALARDMQLDAKTRNGFAVAAASCDLKLKRLTEGEAKALADSNDDNGARRLYILMELARNRQDDAEQQRLVNELEQRFPQNQWLAEALFSSGNMYMLRRDYAQAVSYYTYLAMHFPGQRNAAAAHWRAGWLLYRQGQFPDAARVFDEQIRLYPQATESAAALYWRGRLYELQDHKPGLAVANYRAVTVRYQHYFYAEMSRDRLKALGQPELVSQTQVEGYQAQPVPHLVDTFPADSPHIAKARLIANAGLNDYIAQELAADPDYESWGALAEAQIYASFGETFRAMRSLKKALPYATSAPIKSIPLAYWRILFPEPWWETIKAESAKNSLDPYLVASLIRQESEFKPDAISYANAYGLMQIEPSVGRSLARQEGISGFQSYQLLNPEINIRLGTRYLRQMLDRFGGVQVYALAAYNAGDSRVVDWQAAGPYRGIDEFVESIPFTQTRDYVQAILRNEEIYRGIDAAATKQAKAGIASR
ncbi:MAG TPA: transglycosylase SLT domain-containing protein [Terracidiphilus sp.]|nr:transglycosylase SLT domain-containing protein [Terracidiphilus sp.]